MVFPKSQYIQLRFVQDFDPKTPLFEPALETSKKDKNSCPTLYIKACPKYLVLQPPQMCFLFSIFFTGSASSEGYHLMPIGNYGLLNSDNSDQYTYKPSPKN
jgi:hypothetical protein